MDVTCNIIEDMLPLYADGICSEDTRTIIEHHIALCPECREKLEAMTAKLEKNEKKAKIDNPFKKVRNHYIKLVTVTLLICAVVIAPLGGVWYLSTNAYFGKGYTWSSLSMDIKLHNIANLLKRGKYRKFLDEIELYYDREQYTPEEISMYKDMFAEDFENYFAQYKIRKILTGADGGECDSGGLAVLTNGGGVIQMGFALNEDDRLCFTYFDFDTYYNTELPQMELPDKNDLKTYFDCMRDDDRTIDDRLYLLAMFNQTFQNNKDFNYDTGTHMKNLKNKFAEMLDKYSYVDCETGEITYHRENLHLSTNDYLHRYYSQKAVITMAKKDGEKFTISCDIAIQTMSYPHQAILRVSDIIYSDNTPEDFITMFEGIFVRRYVSKLTLNDGNFYLNGNTESCYFTVSDGNIKFIVGSETQMREFFDAQCEAQQSFAKAFKFDEWCKQFKEEWKDPVPYIVHTELRGVDYIGWNVTYDADGDIVAYLCAYYIDEDNFETNGCMFTRAEE